MLRLFVEDLSPRSPSLHVVLDTVQMGTYPNNDRTRRMMGLLVGPSGTEDSLGSEVTVGPVFNILHLSILRIIWAVPRLSSYSPAILVDFLDASVVL